MAVVLPLALGACQSAPGIGFNPPVDAPATSTRYVDEIFTSVDITTEHVVDVTDSTGAPVSLAMDIYQPGGDTVTDRPVVLFVHGGAWTTGSRSDGQEVALATSYARRGFVAATVDYRLDPLVTSPFDFGDPATTTAVSNGRTDVEAAITHVRGESAALGLDPARIHLVGRDTGATAAVAVAFDSGFGAAANGVTAVVSIGGGASDALIDSAGVRTVFVQGYGDTVYSPEQADSFCSTSTAMGGTCDVVRLTGGHDLDSADSDTANVAAMTSVFVGMF